MTLQVLVIAGTLAPPFSKPYYQSLIDAVSVNGSNVHFVTIHNLGLGEMHDAADRIGCKYLLESSERWVIIGHSQGGLLASLIAMEYSSKVDAVIALASPFKGTTWTDPINMPIRFCIEALSWLSQGNIRLRPTLRKFIVPIPIVGELAAHSLVTEEIGDYLEHQHLDGYITYAFIGDRDLMVLPHRSGLPTGSKVVRVHVVDENRRRRLAGIIPPDIEHIPDHAGHVSIVHNSSVLKMARDIVLGALTNAARA